MHSIIGRAVALSRTVNHPENIQLRVLLLHIEKFADVCAIAQLRERLSPYESVSRLSLHGKRKSDNGEFLKSEIFMSGSQEVVFLERAFKIISALKFVPRHSSNGSSCETSPGRNPLGENGRLSSE